MDFLAKMFASTLFNYAVFKMFNEIIDLVSKLLLISAVSVMAFIDEGKINFCNYTLVKMRNDISI